jgi:HEAT repeat protein
MAKIYVSSTFLDLEGYRAQVEKVIRRMGHIDVAMEYYVAEDQRPVARCLADVTDCDVYVGIFAWRYGWQPKDDNPNQFSITEMEFRQAEKTGKPCLIFLLSEDAPWPRKHMDKDTTKIETLRNGASAKHNGDWFASPDELARKVAEAIYKRIPAAVSIPEHNLDAYYAALRKRYGVLALEGLTPPQKEEYLQIQLRSVFVEQSARENPPPVELPKEVWEKLSHDREIHSEDLPSGMTLEDVRQAREAYYEKPARPVLEALTDTRQRYTILLGDPGSGKSTLARYVMLSLIDPSPALRTGSTGDEKLRRVFDGCLPLLVELRSYAGLCADDKCKSFLEFLEYLGQTEGWALTQAALHNHLKNDGRAVVLFDGLDEIFDPGQREQVARQIAGFCNDYPKARVIVTSRILGYRRKILTDAGFTHFTLQDLDEKQVETFVTRWYDLAMSERPDEARERRERILKSFKDSASIRQLAGNPMLLTIMAIIGKHQELPRERWKLYDHAASVLIQHWDVNKHLKDESIQADFIGEDDKKELLRRLAFHMQGGDGGLAGNYIHRDELQAEFESYLKERYNQAPDRAKIIAEAMIQQFRERNFILSLYGANLYGFVHRAFLEFFCASAFVWKFEKTKELTIEQLKTEVYGKHWEDRGWHEVLRLICGMVDEKWVGEIVESLVDVEYKNLISIIDDIIAEMSGRRSLALSATCLDEVSNLNSMQKVILKFLHHKRWQARYDILMILVNTSGHYSEILPLLRDFVANDTRDIVRRAAVYALAGRYRDDPQTLPLLRERAVKDEHEIVRRAAVSVLAKHYREAPQTLPLLRERAVKDEDGNVRSIAVSALAEHYRQDPRTLPLLREWAVKSEHANVRSAAVDALAKHYHADPQTWPLLRECVVKDKNEDVRRTAVSALAEHYSADPQTWPFLRERAVKDEHEIVRRAAVSALAEHYREAPQTLPLLREWAVKSEHTDVRRAAVSALAEHYRDDPQTLPLLRECAVKDNDGYVRRAAVSALAEHYRADPRTLLLLRECAVKDEHEAVRSAAVSALAEHCRADPQTLPLLRERAFKDEHEAVRSAAVSALAEHCRADPQTLPLLREHAAKDAHVNVRRAAVDALIKHYSDAPQTLPLLRERAVNDEHVNVRGAVVSTLIAHYRDDPQILPLLRERAVKDEYEYVRHVAVGALIQHYCADQQTLPLLHERALKDESPKPDDKKYPWQNYVRETAVNAIAENWPTHPGTLPLLRERAQNDPTPWLRERAKELIAALESEKN